MFLLSPICFTASGLESADSHLSCYFSKSANIYISHDSHSSIFSSTVQDVSKAHLLTAVPNEDPTVIDGGNLYLSAQKVDNDRVSGKRVTYGTDEVCYSSHSALCACQSLTLPCMCMCTFDNTRVTPPSHCLMACPST